MYTYVNFDARLTLLSGGDLIPNNITESIDHHNADLAAHALIRFQRQMLSRPLTAEETTAGRIQFCERLVLALWSTDDVICDDVREPLDLAASLDGIRPDCRFELIQPNAQMGPRLLP
jgi:hypothetical protein